MRRTLAIALFAGLLTLTACHSPYVAATVSNRTPQTIELLEVDYPSASFGTQALAPGADFHYRFKVIGSGTMKLVYTDTAHKEHQATGPTLNEGAEGPLTILIMDNRILWQPAPTVSNGK
jgi:hypothetical protein